MINKKMDTDSSIMVLSDLHIGHPASVIDSPDQLAPLFKEADRIIFNGDTIEFFHTNYNSTAKKNIYDLSEVCLSSGCSSIFINGNHDPAISDKSHIDLMDKAILITHGDILFHNIVPWLKEAALLGSERSRHLDKLDEDALTKLEHHLEATKKAYVYLQLHDLNLPKGVLARCAVLFRECWPPLRPFKIISYWAQCPGRTECMARMFRPFTRFIITGHTHYSGIWHRGNRIIINTGSFLPILNRLAVVIANNKLYVYKIDKKNNKFELGRLVDCFSISRLRSHEIF